MTFLALIYLLKYSHLLLWRMWETLPLTIGVVEVCTKWKWKDKTYKLHGKKVFRKKYKSVQVEKETIFYQVHSTASQKNRRNYLEDMACIMFIFFSNRYSLTSAISFITYSLNNYHLNIVYFSIKKRHKTTLFRSYATIFQI